MVFLKNTNKVIGIHKGTNKNNNENYGNFIYPIINIKKEEKITSRQNIGKLVYKNGKYYIGETLNKQRHGKGTLYYKNRNIEYEGDWNNDKREGKGKNIYEDGEYYIGEWKTDLRNGKGQLFFKNGNINLIQIFLHFEKYKILFILI